MEKRVKIRVKAERLTLEDLIRLEEGDRSTRFVRDTLARFMVGENGEYLPEEEAQRAAGRLNLMEAREAVEVVKNHLMDLKESAVPPA